MVEHALELASQGFHVFPLQAKSKAAALRDWPNIASREPEWIHKMWEKAGSDSNVAVLMGSRAGLVGLDIDLDDGATLDFFENIPPSWCVKSAKGYHVYYRIPEHWPKNIGRITIVKAGKKKACVTLRGDNHYFAAVGSIHPEDGSIYEWATNKGLWSGLDVDILGPGEIECAYAPDWFLLARDSENREDANGNGRGEDPTHTALGTQRAARTKTPSNGRHDMLRNTAVAMRREGRSFEEIRERLRFRNQKDCSPPIGQSESDQKTKRDPEKEIEQIARWAYACVATDPNAKELAEKRAESPEGDIVVSPFPDEDAKGRRLATIENVKELLRRLGVIVRYNGISKIREEIIPGLTSTVDNRDNVTLAWITSWCKRCRIPTSELTGYLTHIADSNLYNPVATWIESEPWDGRSRLQEFYDTVSAPSTSMKEVFMRKWLISCVAAAYEPNGVVARGVLVFQGAQNMGKTHWFTRLAPQEFLKTGVSLQLNDKDSVFKAISNWLCELGELDSTFRKSEISQLKAFLPSQSDTIRRPYERRESHFARRTIFFGSVNPDEFLQDPSGNTRFWVVKCEHINHNHSVNMQQLWAEIKTLYDRGETWHLDDKEVTQLNEQNEKFQATDPIEERITDFYGWGLPEEEVVLYRENATAVCIAIGISNPNRADTASAGRALRRLGLKPDRARQYLMPKKKFKPSGEFP